MLSVYISQLEKKREGSQLVAKLERRTRWWNRRQVEGQRGWCEEVKLLIQEQGSRRQAEDDSRYQVQGRAVQTSDRTSQVVSHRRRSMQEPLRKCDSEYVTSQGSSLNSSTSPPFAKMSNSFSFSLPVFSFLQHALIAANSQVRTDLPMFSRNSV